MKNTDSNKKSFLNKTFEAFGDVVGSVYDAATLPIEVFSNPDVLMKENCTIVSAKDYYHNKNLSDNQIVLVQKNKFLGITYKSLKMAEGAVSNKGREGVWFDYEYSGGETYRTERTEYKNGKKHGSYHEKKVMDNDVYVTTGTYKNGQKNGTFESSKNGAVYERSIYKNDEPVEIYQYDDNGKLINVYKNKFVDNNMSREAPTSSFENENANPHLRLTLSENGTKVSDSVPHSMQPLTNGRDASGLA